MADDDDDGPGFVTVQIPMHTARGLRRDARKRETTVPRLISDLVSVVAQDRLCDAVLDDVPICSANSRTRKLI
jgi:hypothetical protein